MLLERISEIYNSECRYECKYSSLEDIEFKIMTRELKELNTCLACLIKEALISIGVPHMLITSLKGDLHEVFFLEDALIDVSSEGGFIVKGDEVQEYIDMLVEFRVYDPKDVDKIRYMINSVTHAKG